MAGSAIRAFARDLVARGALLLCVAACAAPAPETPKALRAVAALAGPDFDVVEVTVYDIPPGTAVEQVALVGPGGQALPAASLRRSSSESGSGGRAGPSIGLGVTGGSSSGVTPSLELGWAVAEGGPGRQSRRVTARIALPDPAGYRAEAQVWRVEVRYRDVTGTARLLRLPAPEPG